MHPSDEAAAILSHYFQLLAAQAGMKWTPRNASDIARAVELLGAAEAAPLDEVPPYRPVRSDRVTQVIERPPSGEYGDPEFERWRAMRRAEEQDDVRRMARREGTR